MKGKIRNGKSNYNSTISPLTLLWHLQKLQQHHLLFYLVAGAFSPGCILPHCILLHHMVTLLENDNWNRSEKISKKGEKMLVVALEGSINIKIGKGKMKGKIRNIKREYDRPSPLSPCCGPLTLLQHLLCLSHHIGNNLESGMTSWHCWS